MGISQEALAERADLHRTYISDVERGARNLSLESISRLARALAVSVSTLFPVDLEGATPGEKQPGKGLVDVLLVEDNPDDVELTLAAFKKARFTNRTHVVADGAEALEYIFCTGKYAADCWAAQRPQLILLDLDLPKVSGVEVLRRIKSDKKTADMHVVILTTSIDHRNMVQCRGLGATHYIVKPVDFQRLSAVTPHLDLNWLLVKPSELRR